MSLQTITCVTVMCDGCGGDCWERAYDGFTPHWPSEDKAREELAGDGWRLDGDGQVCERCAKIEDCERNGHLWSSWQPHYADPTIEERYCTHCERASEERFVEQAYGATE